MKTIKILLITTTICFFGQIFATTTLSCVTENQECEIMIHVNSEGKIADIIIFMGEKEKYIYSLEDLELIKLEWKQTEKPFNDNLLHLKSKKTKKSKPKFGIKVKGETGKITIKNKEYKIKCDWTK